MKCDECPMSFWKNKDPHLKCAAFTVWWDKDGDDCHLTPDLQRIINAMIAGKWKCEECGLEILKVMESPLARRAPCRDYNLIPCESWQPREGEE